MSYNRPTQAPKGYIPGLGRGAAGFVTASDVSSFISLSCAHPIIIVMCLKQKTTTYSHKIISISCSFNIKDWTRRRPSHRTHHGIQSLWIALCRTSRRQTRPTTATTTTTIRCRSGRLCSGGGTGGSFGPFCLRRSFGCLLGSIRSV